MKKGLALLLTMVMLLGLLASCAKTAEHKKDTEETEKTQQTTQTEQPTEGFTLIGRWKTKYGSDDHEIAINGDNTLVLIDGIDTVSFTYVLAGDTITATPKDGGEDGYVFKLVQETLIRYENGEKDGYEYEKIAAANVCEHNYVEVSRKEPSYGIEGSIMLSCTRCYNLESKKIPELPPVVEIEVKDKITAVQEKEPFDGTDASKECVVAFVLDIKNISDKTIEKICGDLVIQGAGCILTVECEFADLSLAGQTTKNDYLCGYTFDYVSLPTDPERKVYDAEYADLTIFFSLREIVVKE